MPYSPKQPPLPNHKTCSFEGCENVAEHKARRSPRDCHTVMWLCREHARAHNAAWNAFAGLSEAEIERVIRFDTVWERPSWPFGRGPMPTKNTTKRPEKQAFPPEILAAFLVLELAPTLSLRAVKAQYRALAKRTHPDVSPKDKNKNGRAFHKVARAFATIEAYYVKQSQGKTR